MFKIPGTSTTIPARVVASRSTRSKAAWAGLPTTVELFGEVVAMRVHVGGGSGAVTEVNIHLASGAGLMGSWYAIGDFVRPYDEYIAVTALPRTRSRFGRKSFFTHAAMATLRSGTTLNVGLAGPLFGHPGGGEQAEFLDGPPPLISELHGWWMNRYGHA